MRELTSGDHLDQYLLTDRLARTAMATVFKGHDTEAGAPVCLKVPHLEYESDIVFHERFNREESIGRRLAHPNIVRTLEPRMKSRMYLVTEYVAGPSLRSVIESGSLTTQQSLDVAGQLCEALVYLHAQGIIHRDVKPENILVTAAGEVKLLDFGIALHRAARRLTWTNLSATLGTPEYMAPEQIGGRRGDERCDVYATGVILHEMLTGRMPPWGELARRARRARTRERAPSPTSPTHLRPELDPVLNPIVHRAIAHAARDRYQSAAELLERLRRPDAPDPARLPEEASPAGSRRPGAARLLAAVVLATLDFILGGRGSLSGTAAPRERASRAAR